MKSPLLRYSPAEIASEDARWKSAVDPQFTRDAIALSALYDNRGRELVRDHLRTLGMGDKANRDPIQVGTVPRLMESLSVLYAQPATRTLARAEKPLATDDEPARAFRALSRRMMLDQVWAQADRIRNLLRQCVVLFAESAAHESVVSRVYEPFNVLRFPTAGAADLIDEDEAVAFCIRWSVEPNDRLWQLWQHEDDDSWRCWNVTNEGKLLDRQPYGEEGQPKFGGLPAVLVSDELLLGRAWLSIPQGRLSLALNIDAVANDVQLLVKQEGHTQTVVTSSNPAAVPTMVGPDKVWSMETDAKVAKLVNQPKIEEAGQTTERWLALLALSESLPVDAFARNRQVLTGASLMVAERDLERRRVRHTQLAGDEERRAFRKYTTVLRAYAVELGLTPIERGVELYTAFATPSAYQDIQQQQAVSMRELALGTSSMIEHFAMMRRLSPDEARVEWARVQAERIEFPTPTSAGELIAERVATQSASTSVQAQPGQNPGALVPGPHAPGVDATKTPGALNADLGSASEGASVTDKAIRMAS